MRKPRRHIYLVDNLSISRADVIEQGLRALSSIDGVSIDLEQRLLEVTSARNPDHQVQTACEVAGAVIRTKLKKRGV